MDASLLNALAPLIGQMGATGASPATAPQSAVPNAGPVTPSGPAAAPADPAYNDHSTAAAWWALLGGAVPALSGLANYKLGAIEAANAQHAERSGRSAPAIGGAPDDPGYNDHSTSGAWWSLLGGAVPALSGLANYKLRGIRAKNALHAKGLGAAMDPQPPLGSRPIAPGFPDFYSPVGADPGGQNASDGIRRRYRGFGPDR